MAISFQGQRKGQEARDALKMQGWEMTDGYEMGSVYRREVKNLIELVKTRSVISWANVTDDKVTSRKSAVVVLRYNWAVAGVR